MRAAGNPDLTMVQGALATSMAGGTLITTVAALTNHYAGDGDAWSWGLRYDCPLSRHTTSYAGVTGIINGEDARYNVGGGGSSSPSMEVTFGDDPNVLYASLAVKF